MFIFLSPFLPPCSQIVVVCDATGEKWLFPCLHWLCVDCEDGEIERELHAQVEHVKGSGGGDEGWMVRVWTSDMRGGGTDATVSIQVRSFYYATENRKSLLRAKGAPTNQPYCCAKSS